MSFKANELQIKDIISGDSYFVIPRNQRTYVWEEKNWKELASDIKYIFDLSSEVRDVSHFIGSFVLQNDDNQFTIIDGQQRITTIILMLSAICALQNEAGDRNGFGKTKQYIIGDIGLDSEYQRLKNDEIDNLSVIVNLSVNYIDKQDYLFNFNSNLITKSTKANTNVFRAFEFYYHYFNEITNKDFVKLNNIRTIIVDMKVIHIISENELDCYEIFEILNARGVSLKDSELLKNYIYKYVQPKASVDSAKIRWNEIQKNMSDCNENLEQFLVHYCTARFKKKSSKQSVFEIIKHNINKNNINNLLDELVECSKFYVYFYKPERYNGSKTVINCLKFFSLENQRQFRPIFLAYFLAHSKKLITDKELETTFEKIQNFYFSFGLICDNNSNIIENSVYKVANEIYNSVLSNRNITSDIFVDTFSKHYPSKDTFIEKFLTKGFSNKNPLYKNSKNRHEIQYILSSIEKFRLNQNGGELTCDLSNCNIEHISNDSETDDTPCWIGNLLLLSTSINHNIGNEAFSEKVKRYSKSSLPSVALFIKHYGQNTEWGKEQIKIRGKKIAELCFSEIWHF